MKIGIVCYPTYGGSGVVATELGIALANKGHHIHFITYSQPSRLNVFNENIYYHEVSVKNYPLFDYPPYELALSSKIVESVIYQQLELLHVHYAIPHASAAWMAQQILKTKGIRIPIITTLHGTDITIVGKDSSYEPVVTFSINHSDAVTSVSEDLKRDTYSHFRVDKDIEVIPNFIDLDKFQKQKKDHFKIAICPHNERLIVHTSNFRKVKRVQDVIKIFCKIREKIPAKLLLVGDGPERANIEMLTRECESYPDVRFLGKLEQVQEVLSVADLFLMPSEKESFGLAALEAMACEVPVISSNTGGLPELNIDGETGFLCEVGDVDEMAEKSLFVLQEDQLTKFKRKARARAKVFDIHNVLPLYENFYAKTLKNFTTSNLSSIS